MFDRLCVWLAVCQETFSLLILFNSILPYLLFFVFYSSFISVFVVLLLLRIFCYFLFFLGYSISHHMLKLVWCLFISSLMLYTSLLCMFFCFFCPSFLSASFFIVPLLSSVVNFFSVILSLNPKLPSWCQPKRNQNICHRSQSYVSQYYFCYLLLSLENVMSKISCPSFCCIMGKIKSVYWISLGTSSILFF